MKLEISNVYSFETHADAENSVRLLALSGFNMRHLSIKFYNRKECE